MIELSIKNLLRICDARLLKGNTSEFFKGVSIDSRRIEEGQAFFALRGERCDGHQFVEYAFKNGAVCAVVEYMPEVVLPDKFPLIQVNDSLSALQNLASWWRRQFDIPVIGITGSSGKTTTKDILTNILSTTGKVCTTEENYNNEIGVPLTILNLDKHHSAAAVEMAMRARGEIADLCRIADPTAGIITNIGTAHYEKMGSVKNTAEAKGELADYLPQNGFLLLNGDDEWSEFISRLSKAEVIFFGLSSCSHIRAEEMIYTKNGSIFTLNTGNINEEIKTPLLGKHNTYNILSAIGAALCLGINIDDIKKGLEKISVTKMRMQRIKGIRDTMILNDAYNANPSSMQASLHTLKECGGSRTIAVLGDMFELGEIAEDEHYRIGEIVKELKIDYLITVGSLGACIGKAAKRCGFPIERIFLADSNEEAVEFLKAIIKPADTILIKGSRGMGMEEIALDLEDAGELK